MVDVGMIKQCKQLDKYRERVKVAGSIDDFAKREKAAEEEEPCEKDALWWRVSEAGVETRKGGRGRSNTRLEIVAGSLHSTLQCVKNSGCSGSYEADQTRALHGSRL